MPTYFASKFNPDDDEDCPIVGDIFDSFQIMKVGYCLTSELLKEIMHGITQENSKIMDKRGYDVCLARDHISRPGVQWLIWANKT